MNITVITNRKGEIVGTTRGSYSQLRVVEMEEGEQPEISAGLLPGPDQKFTHIDVPDEFAEWDASELHERLKEYLSQNEEAKKKGGKR